MAKLRKLSESANSEVYLYNRSLYSELDEVKMSRPVSERPKHGFVVKFGRDFDQLPLATSLKEYDLLNYLRHPRIIPLYGAVRWTTPAERLNPLGLLMPRAAGSLAQITQQQLVTGASLLYFLADVLLALEYLHAQGYAHRAVTEHNILVLPQADLPGNIRSKHLVAILTGFHQAVSLDYPEVDSSAQAEDLASMARVIKAVVPEPTTVLGAQGPELLQAMLQGCVNATQVLSHPVFEPVHAYICQLHHTTSRVRPNHPKLGTLSLEATEPGRYLLRKVREHYEQLPEDALTRWVIAQALSLIDRFLPQYEPQPKLKRKAQLNILYGVALNTVCTYYQALPHLTYSQIIVPAGPIFSEADYQQHAVDLSYRLVAAFSKGDLMVELEVEALLSYLEPVPEGY